jgi:hypothetical protein
LALLRLLYVVVVVIGLSPIAEDDTQALVFGTVQWNSVCCACVMLWLNAVAHHPDAVMPEGARRCRISADPPCVCALKLELLIPAAGVPKTSARPRQGEIAR